MPCKSCNNPTPTPKRAAYLARGAVKAAQAIIQAPADDETITRRRAICEACIESIPRNAPLVLRSCGPLGVLTDRTCGCSLVLKTRRPDETCPQSKW